MGKHGDLTFTLMSSLMRSVITTCSFPDGAFRISASSPVLIHRPLPSVSSRKVSLLALSLLRYPRTTAGDWTTSSPGLLYSSISIPSGDRSLTLIPGKSYFVSTYHGTERGGVTEPLDPNQISCSALEHTTVLVSVRPKGVSAYRLKLMIEKVTDPAYRSLGEFSTTDAGLEEPPQFRHLMAQHL